jgi:Kef-type K+ transport system membrane component KefB
MYLSPWFIAPLVIFLVLSLVRIGLAISHFKKEGSMPEHSFDIVSGTLLSVDTLGALLAVAAAVLGSEALKFPDAAIAFVSAAAILFAIGAVTGFYLKTMVPRFQDRQNKYYRFRSPFYPCVKAVFVTAQFVMLGSAAIFVIYLVFSVGSGPDDVDPDVDPPAAVASPKG